MVELNTTRIHVCVHTQLYHVQNVLVLGRIMLTKFERRLARQNFSTACSVRAAVLNLALNLVLNLTTGN
jgi:hypothetical protein